MVLQASLFSKQPHAKNIMATSIIKNSPGKLYTLSKLSGNSTTVTLTVEGATNGNSVFFAGRIGSSSEVYADYGIITLGSDNDVFIKHESNSTITVVRSGDNITLTFPLRYAQVMFMSMQPLS